MKELKQDIKAKCDIAKNLLNHAVDENKHLTAQLRSAEELI